MARTKSAIEEFARLTDAPLSNITDLRQWAITAHNFVQSTGWMPIHRRFVRAGQAYDGKRKRLPAEGRAAFPCRTVLSWLPPPRQPRQAAPWPSPGRRLPAGRLPAAAR